MKLLFQIKNKSIVFGRGYNFINVDVRNNIYNNMTDLINRNQNKKFIFDLNNNFKLNLIVLKSLYYSKINKFRITLINPNEIHKYMLSKVFDSSKLLKESKNKLMSYQNYSVKKYNRKFKYNFSIIFITKEVTKKIIEKNLKYISNNNSELIFVVNKKINFKNIYKNVKIIVFKSSSDLRFNISKKKNLGIKSANGKILIIKHDRIKISLNWLKHLEKFDGCFDMYTCKIKSKSFRFLDKIAFKYKDYLFNSPRSFYLTFKEENHYQYMDGGLFVLNNSRFFGNKIFDEKLNWLELEDVDFIAKTKLDCNLISFDSKNSLVSDYKKHFKLSKSPLDYLYKVILRRFFQPY